MITDEIKMSVDGGHAQQRAVHKRSNLASTIYAKALYGAFKPLSTTQRSDLLTCSLHCYKFPFETTRHEIINKLREEVGIRTFHFVPPLIIVEINVSSGRTYEKKSLMARRVDSTLCTLRIRRDIGRTIAKKHMRD